MQKFVQSWPLTWTGSLARNTKIFRLLIAIPALALGPLTAPARSDPFASPWVAGGKSSVRLISGSQGRSFYSAGVEMRLDPGAITYWRTPGDGGAPPVFSFDGSENVANVTILYPAPKRIDEAGTEAFGYVSDVTFPLHIRPKDVTLPVNLALKMYYAVCERICLPNTVETTLSLHPASEPPSVGGAGSTTAITAAEAKVPVRLSETERDKKISIVPDLAASVPTWRLKLAESAKDNPANRDSADDLFAEAPVGWYFETRKTDRPDEFLIVEGERPKTAATAAAPVLLTLTRSGLSYEFAVELQPASIQQ